MLLDCGIDCVQSFQPLTTLGLMYDLVGVLLIGWAFFGKTPPYYATLDTMIIDSPTNATLDGRVGTVLLAIGFLLQTAGSFDWCWTPVVMFGCPVLVLVLVVWVGGLRDHRAKKWQKRLDANPPGLST